MIEKIFGEKLEGVEYKERNAVYGIAVDNAGKIATIKTPTGYFLPGGGVENIETLEECVKREFHEEIGYKIEIQRFIGCASLYHITKTKQNVYGIGHFYLVSLMDKCLEPIEEDHILVWLEPNVCMNALFLEHQAWAVSKVLNQIDLDSTYR